MCPFLLSYYQHTFPFSQISAGDIYFQLVLKNITFCFVQYVIDRFENPTTRVVVWIGFAYPILNEWRITDSNR